MVGVHLRNPVNAGAYSPIAIVVSRFQIPSVLLHRGGCEANAGDCVVDIPRLSACTRAAEMMMQIPHQGRVGY